LGFIPSALEKLPGLAGLDFREHPPDPLIETKRAVETEFLLDHHEPEAVHRVVGTA
jgi:hypothetical protein